MHAASVNPEPGSNSLKNCISYLYPKAESIPYLELFCLSFFLLLEYFFSMCFNEIPLHFSVLKKNFLLFNFQWPSANRLRSACLLYYIISFLSRGFLNFFMFFYHILFFFHIMSVGVENERKFTIYFLEYNIDKAHGAMLYSIHTRDRNCGNTVWRSLERILFVWHSGMNSILKSPCKD